MQQVSYAEPVRPVMGVELEHCLCEATHGTPGNALGAVENSMVVVEKVRAYDRVVHHRLHNHVLVARLAEIEAASDAFAAAGPLRGVVS